MPLQFASSAVAQAHTIEGMLLRLTSSGVADEVGASDVIDIGDMLVAGADTRAVVELAGGGTLTMTSNSRVVFEAAADGGSGTPRIVILSGAFVLDASANGVGSGPITVETAAARMNVEGAAVAISYELETGFRAALVGDALAGPVSADAAARIVNDGGIYLLDPANPGVVVAHWTDPPRPLSVAHPEGTPQWLPATMPADAAAKSATATADAEGEAAPVDADDSAPAFMTGAGLPEAGDMSFVATQGAARGLADQPLASLAPLPIAAPGPAPVISATAAASARGLPHAAPDHGLDALIGLPTAAPVEPPLPPRPPGPPQLQGWEPTGRVWTYEGQAFHSSGDRAWPWVPDQPAELIRPVEGDQMALLTPYGARPASLDVFLGLPHQSLEALVDGVVAVDGSALRTSMTLQAGQTLVFDTLFDAFDSLPLNDFAAFTISNGSQGEAFVISSVAATGSLGATPWQSIEYTVGSGGRYTIGFAVINDALPETRSRLYVDNFRASLDTGELDLIGGGDDVFGGHFALFGPKTVEPEPSAGTLICGFDTRIAYGEAVGRIDVTPFFTEPEGHRDVFSATDGEAMAVLHAYGANRGAIERFLGLQAPSGSPTALAFDLDGTAPVHGSATRLSISVAAGDQLSFDWLFDAGDAVPDNDFAIFTVSETGGSAVFRLSDVRAVGDGGASGWRNSVYTAAEDADLTVGFAVLNDRVAGYYSDTDNSRLLVDNVRLNREFADGYQTIDLPDPGALTTLPVG